MCLTLMKIRSGQIRHLGIDFVLDKYLTLCTCILRQFDIYKQPSLNSWQPIESEPASNQSFKSVAWVKMYNLIQRELKAEI